MPPDWIGSRGYQALGSLVTLAPAAVVLVSPFARLPRRRAPARAAQLG
jgi:hypothetical protein